MSPQLSVVIPTFQRPETAWRAIRSVIGQDRSDVEVIVVDDASAPPFNLAPDLTGDARIRVLHQDRNAGPAAARNRGMQEARGTWLSFLDDDDFLLPNTLTLRLRTAEQHHAKSKPALPIYACGFVELGPDGEAGRIRIPRPSTGLEDFASGCWFSPGSCILIRREAFLKQVGLQDEGLRRLEDYDWFLKAALQGAELFTDPTVGVAWQRVFKPAASENYRNAVRTLERRWGARLPAPARARMMAYLALENAAQARGHPLRLAHQMARSWLYRPRAALHLSPGWDIRPTSPELAASLAKITSTRSSG